jgi:glutamyl-tRNA reductase
MTFPHGAAVAPGPRAAVQLRPMQTWPPFHVVGITHRQADLGLRERFARSRSELIALLSGENGPRRRGVVLSTCNRFEVYWWGRQDWPDWFLASASERGAALPAETLMRRDGEAAIRHLLSVASGLDSQVVGETEILGQVRRAWALAREADATGRELDMVFAGALAAGRRLRRETTLGRPPASVGAVAVAAVSAAAGGSLAGRSVTVVGAGEAARAVVASLAGRNARVVVVSRRLERSERLAAGYRVGVAPWSDLERLLAGCEVAFCATGAPRSFLSGDAIARSRPPGAPPLLLLDLGVPRNVEPPAAAQPGVRILDLDDLRANPDPDPPGTAELVEEARFILEEEAVRLLEKLRGLTAGDVLADLHRLGARLAEEEVALTLDKLGTLSEAERNTVREMADRLVRRVLYPASKSIRARGASAVSGEVPPVLAGAAEGARNGSSGSRPPDPDSSS